MKNYITGFILSILLTVASYQFAVGNLLPDSVLVLVIMGFALIQAFIQLVFFLHLDQEAQPRWNLTVLLSTIGLMLILVVGSLWIMSNLNAYHMMSPSDTDNFIIHDEGIHR